MRRIVQYLITFEKNTVALLILNSALLILNSDDLKWPFFVWL